jgi:hypothetical protein
VTARFVEPTASAEGSSDPFAPDEPSATR